MKRIASMLEQDLKLLLRNAIFWVMAATLILIIIAVKFLIPAEFSASDPALAVYGFAYSLPGSAALESPAAVERHVRETGGVGVVKQGDQLTLIHAGPNDQAATALITLITPPEGALPDLQTTVLRARAGAIPQNLRLLPVFIGFEVVVLGFLMAAVLMLGEKQEQVLKAYRLSPGGPLTYMASKTLLCAGLVKRKLLSAHEEVGHVEALEHAQAGYEAIAAGYAGRFESTAVIRTLLTGLMWMAVLSRLTGRRLGLR